MKKYILLLIAFVLCSCAVRKHMTDTDHASSRDSIVTRYVERVDSVYVDRWHTITQSGDTIYKTDSVVFYQYRWRTNTDTTYICKTDTLRLTTTHIKEVRKPNVFTTTCTALFFLMTFLFGLTVYLWKRSRRQ